MKCASVLLDSRNLDHVDEKNDREYSPSDILADEKVYDAPRGLSKIPIRNDRGDNSEDDDWTINDSDESKAIFQNKSVQSKMVKFSTQGRICIGKCDFNLICYSRFGSTINCILAG